MESAQSRGRFRPARVLFFALLAALAWCALTLFTPSSSASADDGGRGSGLLGVVTDAVSGVGDTLQQTVVGLDSVVTGAVQAVAPVAQPVVAPVSEPVVQPVVETVGAVPPAVNTVAAIVNEAASSVVAGATGAVSEIAEAEVVSQITEPVLDLVSTIPVVGTVADRLELDTVVREVAVGVDSAASELVGTGGPVDAVLPALPVPDLDPITGPATPPDPAGSLPNEASDLAAAAVSFPAEATRGAAAPPSGGAGHRSALVALAIPATPQDVEAAGPPRGSPPGGALPGALGTTSGSAAGGSAAGTNPTLASSPLAPDAPVAVGLSVTADDALPGAPVYDTDVSPD